MKTTKRSPLLVRDGNRVWEIIDRKTWARLPNSYGLSAAARVLYTRVSGEWFASGESVRAPGSSLLDGANLVPSPLQGELSRLPQVAEG